jgi:peptide/nickel transport system ATP-binding protein
MVTSRAVVGSSAMSSCGSFTRAIAIIADEPTTALDVTIQAQVLELLHSLQDQLGTAMLFITHDMGVVANIAHDVTVLYAGQVVEDGPVDDVFHQPQHPYTEGLLDAMPQLAPPGEPLHGIPGLVPRPDQMPKGCRFAPRCPHAADECTTTSVDIVVRGASRTRCLRIGALDLRGTRPVPSAVHHREGPVEAAPLPLLQVAGLTKDFAVLSGILRRRIGTVSAVDDVSFSVEAGTTLGLVGESGSGKTTTARMILRLDEPTSGRVCLSGTDITGTDAKHLQSVHRRMQVVFQDPYSSLDPRATIAESVGEPLEVHEHLGRSDRDDRVASLLEQVGLGSHLLRRFPHEFSGGQRQRIALARALALKPELIICDEPVSALDVSTQSQVVNLLIELQRELGVTYVFIAHDLSVVRHISHRIAVMYLGRLVEVGPTEEIYGAPRHPYTQALLSAIPVPDPRLSTKERRIVLSGDIPSPLHPPTGCRFHTRCGYAMPVCGEIQPAMTSVPGGGTVACHLHTDGPALSGRPLVELGLPTTAGARSSGSY